MAKKVKEYFKLPGRGIKRGSILMLLGIRARLWRGNDHVINVLNMRFTEEYNRFYYSDIQAITIFKTSRAVIWNIFFTVVAIIFTLLSLNVEDYWIIFFAIFAALFFIFLVINLLLGTTCITHLHTAVSKEELPSLCRFKTAIKTVKIITPFIEKAQGQLKANDIPEKLEVKMKAMKNRGPSLETTVKSKYDGKLHAALFYLLLASCCLSALDIYYEYMALSLFSTVLFFSTTAVLITALIKQHESALTNGLKYTSWATLAYMLLLYITTYIFFIMNVVLKEPELMTNQWESFKYLSSLSALDNPFLLGLHIAAIICSFLLGIAGLIQLRSFRKLKTVTSIPTSAGSPASRLPKRGE